MRSREEAEHYFGQVALPPVAPHQLREYVRSMWGQRFAYANCHRCHAPAFPTAGYCSRFCEECDVYDGLWFGEAMIVCHKPGFTARITNTE